MKTTTPPPTKSKHHLPGAFQEHLCWRCYLSEHYCLGTVAHWTPSAKVCWLYLRALSSLHQQISGIRTDGFENKMASLLGGKTPRGGERKKSIYEKHQNLKTTVSCINRWITGHWITHINRTTSHWAGSHQCNTKMWHRFVVAYSFLLYTKWVTIT